MPSDRNRLLDMPGHLVRRLQQISVALFIEQARDFDITPVQYAALVAIDKRPGLDQTALCNVIAFDRSTIGDVVGRLERKKLIRRVSGTVDRRTKALYLTAAGRRLLRRIEPSVQSAQRLILAPLLASQRHAFMQMLKLLVHLNNGHSRAPQRSKEALASRAAHERAPRRRAQRRLRRRTTRREGR